MSSKMTDEYFLALFADDIEIAVAASESFISTYPELKAKTVNSLNTQNGLEAKNALHALKGAVSVFSNETIPVELKKIEEVAKTGNVAIAKSMFEALKKDLDIVYSEVENFLKRNKN